MSRSQRCDREDIKIGIQTNICVTANDIAKTNIREYQIFNCSAALKEVNVKKGLNCIILDLLLH